MAIFSHDANRVLSRALEAGGLPAVRRFWERAAGDVPLDLLVEEDAAAAREISDLLGVEVLPNEWYGGRGAIKIGLCGDVARRLSGGEDGS